MSENFVKIKEVTKVFSYPGETPQPLSKKARRLEILKNLKRPALGLLITIAILLIVGYCIPSVINNDITRILLAIPVILSVTLLFNRTKDAYYEIDQAKASDSRIIAHKLAPEIAKWVNENFDKMKEKAQREDDGSTKYSAYEIETAKAINRYLNEVNEVKNRDKFSDGFVSLFYKNRYSEEELTREERYLVTGRVLLSFEADARGVEVQAIEKELETVNS